MVVLCIIFFGFADAFVTLSLGSSDSEDASINGQYVTSFTDSLVYTYRIGLGDFAVDQFANNVQPTTVWILFLLCTILNVIVMLNLLIAIISESFANIQTNST
jgi:hypothetical protein